MVFDGETLVAVPGFAEALLGGLEADVKRVLTELVRYVLPNGKFGPPDSHQTKSESFQAYWLKSTTASTASDEFSVIHGMGRTPYLALPCLDLTSSGGQAITLTVSRPADGQRIYFRSPSTAAPVVVLVE